MFTVLVIDDNYDLRTLTRLMLERMGHQGLTARNGIEGIFVAEEAQPDLILLDIMMDGLSGYDTCRQLRASGYCGRIVLMSAISEANGKLEAMTCGADDYLEKPINNWSLTDQFASLQAALEANPSR